jgi:hypothetical protein
MTITKNKQQQVLVRMQGWGGTQCEKLRKPIHCWWGCKLVQPLWKSAWSFLNKLKIELPYDLAIQVMGIYLKESKSSYNRYLHICIYHSPVHNNQIMEYIHIYIHNGLLFIHKVEQNNFVFRKMGGIGLHHVK